ncbi:oligosaccharide repeat unit polymerase [Leisingera daeponensis]|uniref:Oligosaccharide repeat unit polymerase n=1 Tax=Leisingera daeponensis TaxID=405746 RepID=A0ABS7NIE1_9RHOB|nr:oligosaccharide repeat unit polymerase [Leisingera daeponensis]MBY6140973.1 oligosaccharide repeat unit polymerase [Leisingera daeponensis]
MAVDVWLAAVLVAAMLSYAVVRQHINLALFLTLMLLGVVFRFGYIDAGLITEGYFFREVRGKPADLLWSYQWLLIFTLAAFAAYGASGNGGRRAAQKLSNACKLPVRSDLAGVSVLAAAAMLAAAIMFIASLFGGLGNAIQFLSRRAGAGTAGLGFITLSLQFSFVFIGLAIHSARINRRFFLASAAMAMGLLQIWIIFATGSRGTAAINALGFSLFWFWTPQRPSQDGSARFGMRPRTALMLAAAGTVAVFLLVVVGGAIRDVAQGKSQSLDLAESFDGAALEFAAALPIVDLMSAVKTYVDYQGHDYGMQFINYLGRFIPRSIWTEKPDVFGVAMRVFFSGDRLSGVPPTMAGEWYIAFGGTGILLGGILLGFILRVCDKLWLLARTQSHAVIPAVFLTGTVPVRMVREGMEIGVFFLIYITAAFILFRFISRLKAKRQPAL